MLVSSQDVGVCSSTLVIVCQIVYVLYPEFTTRPFFLM